MDFIHILADFFETTSHWIYVGLAYSTAGLSLTGFSAYTFAKHQKYENLLAASDSKTKTSKESSYAQT